MLYLLAGSSDKLNIKAGRRVEFRWSAPFLSREQACQRCQPSCPKQIIPRSHWRPSPRKPIREKTQHRRNIELAQSHIRPQSTPDSRRWPCSKSAHCLAAAGASQREVALLCFTKSLLSVCYYYDSTKQRLPSGESRTCLHYTATAYSNAFHVPSTGYRLNQDSCQLSK